MSEFLTHYGYMFWPLLALCLVAGGMPLAGKLAIRCDLVDHPGGRKVHEGVVPLVGGIVIFSVFIGVSLLAGFSAAEHWPLYSALALLVGTGAVDDKIHMHAFVKFSVQFIAAGLVVLGGGAQLAGLGDLFGLGEFWLGFMQIPFSIVAVVLLINAVNLMDGVDGLAGGISFVMLAWFFAGSGGLAGASGDTALSALVLMGGLAGFLAYNMRTPFRRKASVFLGDAGSMALGLMAGWYAISLAPQGGAQMEPIAVAWVLAVPIWDECAQFYRRVRDKRHPFSPDRGHLHHHLLHTGFSDGQAVAIILGMVGITGTIGVAGVEAGVPLPVLTVLWIVGILTHMALSKDEKTYPALLKKLAPKLDASSSRN